MTRKWVPTWMLVVFVSFIFVFFTCINYLCHKCIEMRTDLEELRERIVRFTEERDWDQFHDGKNLAIALELEAAELLELYLWKEASEVDVDKVREELADVFNYAILIADKYGLDVKQIVLDKLERNARKYPVEKARGTARKYNEL